MSSIRTLVATAALASLLATGCTSLEVDGNEPPGATTPAPSGRATPPPATSAYVTGNVPDVMCKVGPGGTGRFAGQNLNKYLPDDAPFCGRPPRERRQRQEARRVTRCEDVTSYDYNWDNDMRCTRPDGSVFYTDYAGAAQYR